LPRYGEVPTDEPEDADVLTCYQEVNLGDGGIVKTDGLWEKVTEYSQRPKKRIAVIGSMNARTPLPYPPEDHWENGHSFL
jgi:hypothetical protein